MIDSREIIDRCINYIEKNIYLRITLDDLSQHTGLSKFYLHRMFKALTGESVMDYVQSRKLSSSINELIYTNKRIIDIAMDYGFDFEQSYIRAFKKRFEYTPLKVRTEQISIVIKEKINMKDILSVNNTMVYKPFFVFKQKFDLIGVKHRIMSKSGDKTSNTLGIEFFHKEKYGIKNAVNQEVYFGYTDWSDNDGGDTYYIPSLQVKDLKSIPQGMTGISIPPHKYVVFRLVGFFKPEDIKGRQIGRLLVQMYSKWITNSNYRLADSFRFEYIDTRLAVDNYCEFDIYQPIVDI